MGWLLTVVTVLVIIVAWGGHAWWWPWQRCPACYGRSARGKLSTPRAYNRCYRCKGKGERVRPSAVIVAKLTGLRRY